MVQDKTSDPNFDLSQIFKDLTFLSLIVSMVATYGIWLIAALLFFDPWHMFTCLLQYMILQPTWINVLNVYAFCNTHDVSWGTKGDDKPDELPKVDTKDGKGKTDLPDEGDLNAQYERELAAFSKKHVVVEKPPSDAQKAEAQMDYYRWIRSLVVLVWMVTNFGLVAAVLSSAGTDEFANTSEAEAEKQAAKKTQIYMFVILWSVAVLSGFKFLGAMWFLVVRVFRGV